MNLRNWCTHKLPNGKSAIKPTPDGLRCSVCGSIFPKDDNIDEDIVNKAIELLQDIKTLYIEVPSNFNVISHDPILPPPPPVIDFASIRRGKYRYDWWVDSDFVEYRALLRKVYGAGINDRRINDILSEYCNQIDVIMTPLSQDPTEDELRNSIKLRDHNTCPYGLDGHCAACINLICTEIPKSYSRIEESRGYCIRKEKKEEAADDDN